MRVALRVGYLGEAFFGYQRQPGKRTVEGCIIEALQGSGLLDDLPSSRFASAARTDRGASALGQVISFDLPRPAKAICPRLNKGLPGEIFAWSAATVPTDFHPRKTPHRKTYVYILREGDVDPGGLAARSKLFEGEHDFAQFCRPSPRQTARSVEEIRVEGRHPILIYFTARGFLWTQVRKMVTAMAMMERGQLEETRVRQALDGTGTLALAPAPAENLVLLEIEYPGLDFTSDAAGIKRAKEFLDESTIRLESAISVREALLTGLSGHAPVA